MRQSEANDGRRDCLRGTKNAAKSHETMGLERYKLTRILRVIGRLDLQARETPGARPGVELGLA